MSNQPKRKTPKLIARVTSLGDLRQRASADARYVELAIVAAKNLGASPSDLTSALRALSQLADETSEPGVVGEVNYCRDLVGGAR